jgi:hypothetical protein
MVKKLISRAEFGRLAGVSGAAVTKACSGALKSATEGKRIDVAHPLAVNYLETKARDQTEPRAPGLDSLYEFAVQYCQDNNRYSASGLQQEFRIGYSRATRIVQTMRAGGLIPEGTPKPPPVVTEPVAIKKPHVRGTASAREKKKREAEQDNEIVEIPEDIQSFADMTLRELIEKFGTDFRFIDWLSAIQKIEAINEKRLKNAEAEGKLVSRKLVKVGILEPIDACHIKLLTDGAKTIARRVTAMHSAERPLDEIEKFVAEQITSFIKPVKAKVARALKNA